MPLVDIEVKGLIELQRKMEQVLRDTNGEPVLNAMRDSTLKISALAKKGLVGYNSPSVGGVDTGRLRASITPEVRTEGRDILGVVGSNVEYAPYVENDTRPHWPPLAALQVWAERHGTTAYLVARAIAARGTKGKHFMSTAFGDAEDWIIKRFERAMKEIVDK